MTTHRIPFAAALLAAAALAAPSVAAAKGGDPAPPPAPTVLCDYGLDGPTDAGYVFSNQAGDAGCITVISSNFVIRLYALALTPGWTGRREGQRGRHLGGRAGALHAHGHGREGRRAHRARQDLDPMSVRGRWTRRRRGSHRPVNPATGGAP
jgi:hypothetical protein